MKTIHSTEINLRDLLARHRLLTGEQSKYQTAHSHAARELADLNDNGNLLAEDTITRLGFLQTQSTAMQRRLPALQKSLQTTNEEIITAAAFFIRNAIHPLIETSRTKCATQARRQLQEQFHDEDLLDQAVAGTAALQALDNFKNRAQIRYSAAEFSGDQAYANYAATLLATFEELQTFVAKKKNP